MSGANGSHIFMYRPGAIGDSILTLPAIAALRQRYPGCELTYAGNAACLPLLPVDHAISADDLRLLPLFREPPQPYPGADMHVIFARAPTGLPGIQCDPLEAVAHSTHVADWLVDSIDARFDDRSPCLRLEPLKREGLVMHPGAGRPSKRWPVSHFAALANALGMPPIVVTGPAEADSSQQLASSLGSSQIWDSWDLPALAHALAGARLFVGNDSGISHLAASLGVPTLALYLETDPAIWGIRGRHVQLLAGRHISVDAALRSCRELLGQACQDT